jgi:hypothetical protein
MSARWRPNSRPRPSEQQRGVNGRVPRDPAGSVPRHELLAGLRLRPPDVLRDASLRSLAAFPSTMSMTRRRSRSFIPVVQIVG